MAPDSLGRWISVEAAFGYSRSAMADDDTHVAVARVAACPDPEMKFSSKANIPKCDSV